MITLNGTAFCTVNANMINNDDSEMILTHIAQGTNVIAVGHITLGILVIILASLAVWLNRWFLGLILFLVGALDLSQFIIRKNPSLFRWRFLVVIFSSGIACILLFFPDMSIMTLSLIIAIFLIFCGIHKIIVISADRPPNWGYVVFGGGMSIILGFFILSQWPVENFLILCVLLGIEIVLNGWSLLMAGYQKDKSYL